MKKPVLLLALALCACTPQPSFTFVHCSDPQIGFFDQSDAFIHSDTLMQKAVTAINALTPDLVFITGDLIDKPWVAVQDSIYRTHKAELAAPVWEVPGNHDIMGYSAENHGLYMQMRGYDRFSFRHKGCAFIGIDTNCIKDDGEEAAVAEKEQLQWLRSELDAARSARQTFIFLHCPVYFRSFDEPDDYFNFPAAKREAYHALFKENGVTAVFSGHTHRSAQSVHDGILYCTAGPVGNALVDDISRGCPGYHVVTVNRHGVTADYVPTPGVDPSTAQF